MDLISEVAPGAYFVCLLTLLFAVGPAAIWKFNLQHRKQGMGWVLAFISVFGPCIGLMILFMELAGAGERVALRGVLEQVQSRDPIVLLNGTANTDSDAVIAELLRMDYAKYRHSSPGAGIDVQVTAGTKTLHILIRQDRTFPDEFWVFRGPDDSRRKIATLNSPMFREWLRRQEASGIPPSAD